MLYDLHDHQSKMLNMLRESFSNGMTRPVVYATTGWGKTILAAHVVAGALDKGKRVLFIAPYTSLINQTARSFMEQGIPKPGIMQADHPWTDPSKRLQIGTIQTISRRGWPDADLIIVDEAHNLYTELVKYMENNKTPVIGLTATPFTKGMGKYYNNLLQSISLGELMDKGFLSKYEAFAHSKPDLSKVKVTAGEYQQDQLGKTMSDPKLVGCVVDTWLKHGENLPTICFSVNVAHAEHIGAEFEKVNVSNAVITGKTPIEEREEIFKQFKKGNIKILVSCLTLIAGFDSWVYVMIDAQPTKSLTRHLQKLGRNLRNAPSKKRAIILDHANNLQELGFPEDISIKELCNGNKQEAKEKAEKQKKEIKEKLPKDCPKCAHLKKADEFTCSKCGFTPKFIQNVEVADGNLVSITGTKEKFSKEDKQRIHSECLGALLEARLKGKNYKDGWASNLYRDIVGVWPKGLINKAATPGEQIKGFIKHKNIKLAKSKEKRKQLAKFDERLERRQGIMGD